MHWGCQFTPDSTALSKSDATLTAFYAGKCENTVQKLPPKQALPSKVSASKPVGRVITLSAAKQHLLLCRALPCWKDNFKIYYLSLRILSHHKVAWQITMGSKAGPRLNKYGEVVADRLSAGKNTHILLLLGLLILTVVCLIAIGIIIMTHIRPAGDTLSQPSPTIGSTLVLPLSQAAAPTLTRPPSAIEGSWESLPVIPTPAPTPTLYPCWIDPGPTLRDSWTAQLRQNLGCPTTEERGEITAYQPFELGFMLWRSDTAQIYVFFDDGSTQLLQDTWREGEPEYPCLDNVTPARTPPTPRRGLGKAWCIEPKLRSRLGNALADERGDYRSLQDFEHGAMVVIPERERAYLLFLEPHSSVLLPFCQDMATAAQSEDWNSVLLIAVAARDTYGDSLGAILVQLPHETCDFAGLLAQAGKQLAQQHYLQGTYDDVKDTVQRVLTILDLPDVPPVDPLIQRDMVILRTCAGYQQAMAAEDREAALAVLEPIAAYQNEAGFHNDFTNLCGFGLLAAKANAQPPTPTPTPRPPRTPSTGTGGGETCIPQLPGLMQPANEVTLAAGYDSVPFSWEGGQLCGDQVWQVTINGEPQFCPPATVGQAWCRIPGVPGQYSWRVEIWANGRVVPGMISASRTFYAQPSQPDPCAIDSDGDGVKDCRDQCPNQQGPDGQDKPGCPQQQSPFRVSG